MNRVDAAFASLRAQGRKGLIPFLVGARPSPEGFLEVLKAVDRAGPAAIEIGFPFSDPVADGPVIAAAMHAALADGATPGLVFDLVAGVRQAIAAPLIAMVSASIVERFGPAEFAKRASAAGFDGVIIPDAPIEEFGAYAAGLRAHGLAVVHLIAPTTPPDRERRIASSCGGFIYVLARAGITGGAADLDAEALRARLNALRGATSLPLAVGFGIATPEHARRAVFNAGADAAIVGSALVRAVEEAAGAPGAEKNASADAAHKFVCTLVSALNYR